MSELGDKGQRLVTMDPFSGQDTPWLAAFLCQTILGSATPGEWGYPSLKWRAGAAMKAEGLLCPSNSPSCTPPLFPPCKHHSSHLSLKELPGFTPWLNQLVQ